MQSSIGKKREQPKFLINDSSMRKRFRSANRYTFCWGIPSQSPPFLHQVPHGAFPSFTSAPPLNLCLCICLSLRVVVLCEHTFSGLAFLMWYFYTTCPVSVQRCDLLFVAGCIVGRIRIVLFMSLNLADDHNFHCIGFA